MVSVGEYEMSLDEHWEYPRQNLRLGDTLGEGEFGKVVQAEAKDIWKHGNDLVTVAVKMLKDDHLDSDMIDLVSEMELMKLLGTHQNILRLLGCCSQGGPLLVITEYARNGNLKNFLRKYLHHSIKIEENTLLTYARQIAQGMVYLSSIKCIHRDLAARNILVTAQYTMKIADFGLARDVKHTEYYKKTSKGRLPIKWMAPEALFHNRYTTQSDVWSFGVLLWEIITLGDDPYPSIEDLAGLRNALKQNYRMEKPANASTNVYNLMMDCWSFKPEDRPNFLSVVERLKELVTDARPKSTFKNENITTDDVILYFLTRFDTGWYTCLNLSTEGYPKVTCSIWLEVRCGGNRIVLEGTPNQAIELCCSDELNLIWYSTWFVNTTRETTTTMERQVESGFCADHAIPEITYLDEGLYECQMLQNSIWMTIGVFHLKIWNGD
ncbi:fibroblast growth factor receptor 2-like [Planococcus citri]|uniref:fibroblast growth factor receptor 2-like n=1 Tax=Planococcus citri TaxID=170843 RepID=UPI0031F906B8